MQKLFFSIIVVSLNAGKELKRTLDSILVQTCPDYEILLKDGGSKDGSLDFLKEGGTKDGSLDFCEQKEPAYEKVRIYEKKDRGIYDAMNQALEYARGHYLLFLNCGDYLHDSQVLERVQGEILREQDAKKAVGNLLEAKEEDEGLEREKTSAIYYGNLYNRKQKAVIASAPIITDFTLYRNVPCHQVCFYHRGLFKERGYDIRYKVRADYEHFLYCVKAHKVSCSAMEIIIASYEGGGYSETKENRRVSAKEHKEITMEYLGREKCIKYGMILWLTLAPLRSKIVENPKLSSVYNGIKSLVYQGWKR